MTVKLTDFTFIDIHYHANPDLYSRRLDALEAGKQYQQLNGAVVLKSHLGSTSVQATIAQAQGLPVFPSLVLNQVAGGIHYRPIMQALAEYQPTIPSKLLVHFPTITGRRHQSKLSRDFVFPAWSETLNQSATLFDDHNKLRSDVIDVLKFAADHPIVLSSGHSNKAETYELINACEQFGVKQLLLNQPANPLTGLNATDLLEIVKHSFVWVEQTALTYLLGYQSAEDFQAVLQSVPNVIYSSDLGQTSQMTVSEWYQQSTQWFNDMTLPPSRKAEICLRNPSKLITI